MVVAVVKVPRRFEQDDERESWSRGAQRIGELDVGLTWAQGGYSV